jgi:hypothetical protein
MAATNVLRAANFGKEITKENQVEIDDINKDENFDPVANFLIALKAPETKRQYPKRLEVLFNFLKLEGSFENKSFIFYNKSLENPKCMVEFNQLG